MSNEVLNVWYESQLVGQIECDINGQMGFTYTEQWCKQGFPISQQIPLENKIYSSL